MLPRYKAIDNETGVMLRVLSIDLEFDYIIGLPFEEEARDTFGELIIEKRYYFEDIELLQSTGLFDKNGKEIFEGDILGVPVAIDTKTLNCEVVFEDGIFGIKDSLDGWGFQIGLVPLIEIILAKKVMVIGNKFEHPHLLEEE